LLLLLRIRGGVGKIENGKKKKKIKKERRKVCRGTLLAAATNYKKASPSETNKRRLTPIIIE